MKRFAIFTGVCLSLALSIGNLPACAQSGELRTIPLVVMTSAGKFVADVTPQNVRIKAGPASVGQVVLDTGPRHIVVMLDVSGSMETADDFSSQTRWECAKEISKAFLVNVTTRDFVALDLFAAKEEQIVPFTHDVAAVRRAIDDLPKPDSKATRKQYHNTTAAGDALDSVLVEDGPSLGFGDAVVFFSDGVFGGPDRTGRDIDSMREKLGQRGIRVFLALAFQNWPLGAPDGFNVETASDSFLVMADTGGFSFVPAAFPMSPSLPVYRVDSTNSRMAALANAVQGTYRLQLQLEAPFHKKQKLQLEIVDNQGKRIRNVFLYYPRNLYPDSPSNP